MINEFAFVIKSHPNKAVASYKGVTADGIFDISMNKLYSEDNTYIFDKAFTFTYLTSSLPTIDKVKTVFIDIDGSTYRILNATPESKFITNLALEEKK